MLLLLLLLLLVAVVVAAVAVVAVVAAVAAVAVAVVAINAYSFVKKKLSCKNSSRQTCWQSSFLFLFLTGSLDNFSVTTTGH